MAQPAGLVQQGVPEVGLHGRAAWARSRWKLAFSWRWAGKWACGQGMAQQPMRVASASVQAGFTRCGRPTAQRSAWCRRPPRRGPGCAPISAARPARPHAARQTPPRGRATGSQRRMVSIIASEKGSAQKTDRKVRQASTRGRSGLDFPASPGTAAPQVVARHVEVFPAF
jgi:hypothetical protein